MIKEVNKDNLLSIEEMNEVLGGVANTNSLGGGYAPTEPVTPIGPATCNVANTNSLGGG